MEGEKGEVTRKVRMVSEEEPRVESGAVQFGDDWPGLFLRGDECVMLSASVEAALRAVDGVPADDVTMAVAKSYLSSLVGVVRRDVLDRRDSGQEADAPAHCGSTVDAVARRLSDRLVALHEINGKFLTVGAGGGGPKAGLVVMTDGVRWSNAKLVVMVEDEQTAFYVKRMFLDPVGGDPRRDEWAFMGHGVEFQVVGQPVPASPPLPGIGKRIDIRKKKE